MFEPIIEVDENGFWKNRNFPQKSLEYCSNLFNKINGKVIVEIGSGIHNDFFGNSLLFWVRTCAKKIFAIDCNENKVNEIKKLKEKKIIAIKQDGISFLKNFEEKIDLLYLDFSTKKQKNQFQSNLFCANCYLSAYNESKNKLNKNSIILIDDTDHTDPWKQTFITQEAQKDFYKIIYVGRQTLLFRKKQKNLSKLIL